MSEQLLENSAKIDIEELMTILQNKLDDFSDKIDTISLDYKNEPVVIQTVIANNYIKRCNFIKAVIKCCTSGDPSSLNVL
jgi:hypothetical protein